MGESVKPVGQMKVLDQSRLWPAIAIPGVLMIVMIVVGVLFDVVSWMVLVFGAGPIIIAVTRTRNAVFADDLGLLVRDRSGLRRSYSWAEIERMGWVDMGLWGISLAVYPRGGPYDVPGPNASTNVGRIWRLGRRRSINPVPELLKTHGIKGLSDQ
ncbi:hypothetical protein [Micromonospora sp. DH14]|uniref:hypothetical protein n=1 Tax=Micromonospora sp. DH14 TaxID=3040120 RepID=UPI0024416722|nr:hypothetical protein [Micromonospora sp. DH14]MDG9678088.1 hypothetical protein [Micromonospora sp. DH14]